MLERIWRGLKRWRHVHLGPVSMVFRLERRVPLIGSTRQPLQRLARPEPQPHPPADQATSPQAPEVALIVGVGAGYGEALARHLAQTGMTVIMAARNARKLDPLVDEISRAGYCAYALPCDATREDSVRALFARVAAQHGCPHLVVYALQSFGPGQASEIELAAFEDGWRRNCVGAFLVAREAARLMTPRSQGTILLTGSTSALIGREGHLNLAVGKFGQRALAQVLARELWPKGIHVVHLVIDADIHEGRAREDGGPQADPGHLASLVHMLHRQPRSAWTSELDVRPWNERFWEHC